MESAKETFNDLKTFVMQCKELGHHGIFQLYPFQRGYPQYYFRIYKTKDRCALYRKADPTAEILPKLIIDFNSNDTVLLQMSDGIILLDRFRTQIPIGTPIKGDPSKWHMFLKDKYLSYVVRDTLLELSRRSLKTIEPYITFYDLEEIIQNNMKNDIYEIRLPEVKTTEHLYIRIYRNQPYPEIHFINYNGQTDLGAMIFYPNEISLIGRSRNGLLNYLNHKTITKDYPLQDSSWCKYYGESDGLSIHFLVIQVMLLSKEEGN